METVAAARPPQFKTIAEVEGTAANTLVDILGVVTVVEAATTITLRNGGEALKRALTIVDTSCKTVEVRRPPRRGCRRHSPGTGRQAPALDPSLGKAISSTCVSAVPSSLVPARAPRRDIAQLEMCAPPPRCCRVNQP